MKWFTRFLTFLLTFTLLNACENEPYEDGIYIPESNELPQLPEEYQNNFSAQLDGEPFVDQNIYTTTSVDNNNANFMAITATKTAYHSIIIYLPLTISVGTYQFSPESMLTVPNLNVTYSNLEDLLQSGIGEGTMVIEFHESVTHHIQGHFECVINSQNGSVHHITNGTFDVEYD